ncbi:hypothetical protein RB608_18150 [Nocardioides sp. LHD-245]|uniref:hypothetical protein n=1 Tax=Nocardioides sp. LHD-245 TaxID=3051387 RepID=UPI0027E1D3D8|nr:hypothetical protein [Nocardioides sp. LHD-245]
MDLPPSDFFVRYRDRERERAARTLESQLRGLWRCAPLSGTVLEDHAQDITWLLGSGSGEVALHHLTELLSGFIDDEEIAGLAVALGLHPAVSTGDVDERFSAYALHLGKSGDSATGRRRANRGVQRFAEFLSVMDQGDSSVGILDIELAGSEEEIEARMIMHFPSNRTRWVLRARSNQLPTTINIASSDQLPDNPPAWLERREPWERRWHEWKAFALKGQLGQLDRVSLEIDWLATVPPRICFEHHLPFPTSVTVVQQVRGIWIMISKTNHG